MIELKSVCKRYHKCSVLEKVSLCFPSKGVFIINGYNGAGKTTLLNIISLMDNHFEGELCFDGENFNKKSFRKRQEFRNKNISYVLYSNNLFSFLNAKDNLLLDSKLEYTDLLNEIDLNKNINQLSGGQQMLISLTRVINQKKRIILLDEVTSQLSDENVKKLMNKLIEISKECLIILVTHDLRVLNRYPLKTYELKEGKLA